MKLIEIYRIAIARGLTAKEAGAEFNIRYESLHKVGSKHKLPRLISEYDKQKMEQIKKMSTDEINNYVNMIQQCVEPNLKELTFCMNEIERRRQQL